MSDFRLEPYRSLRERYMRDVKFRAVVDQMCHLMHTGHVTPYELRDAAYVASMKFAEETIEPFDFAKRFPELYYGGRTDEQES